MSKHPISYKNPIAWEGFIVLVIGEEQLEINLWLSALLCFWYMFHNYNNLRLSIRDLYPDPYRILCMIQSGIPMALNQTVVTTDTQDMTGTVKEDRSREAALLKEQTVEAAILQFVGDRKHA